MKADQPNTKLYPFLIEPKLTAAVWGGDELARTYGKHGDPSAKLGESWECWDANVVTNGAFKGSTVAMLRKRLGAQFLGSLDPERLFPILTKIITAHDWLSVQVHPDDAYAQRVEHQLVGKTECWYVLAALPQAELVVGWNRDTSRDEYEYRVAHGTLAELLRKIPVHTGDSIYVPSGLVHAIGPGVTVFETQQASDLTYRLYDWNRLGLDGKPRELHVAKAADVLNYRSSGASTLDQIDYHYEGFARTALIADPTFTVERILATAQPTSLSTAGRPLIIMSLERVMQVACFGLTTSLQKFQTVLIPAAAGCCTIQTSDEPAPFLFVTPAQSPHQLARRLSAAGITESRTNAFTAQFSARTL